MGFYATFTYVLAKLSRENLLRIARWMTWHCPPATGFGIQDLAVLARPRYLTAREAPRNIESSRVSGEETHTYRRNWFDKYLVIKLFSAHDIHSSSISLCAMPYRLNDKQNYIIIGLLRLYTQKCIFILPKFYKWWLKKWKNTMVGYCNIQILAQPLSVPNIEYFLIVCNSHLMGIKMRENTGVS